LRLAVFISQSLSTAVDAFVVVWRPNLVQPVSAAHTFDTPINLRCLHVVFPALTACRFGIFSSLLIENEYLFLMTPFSAFSDLVDLKYWG